MSHSMRSQLLASDAGFDGMYQVQAPPQPHLHQQTPRHSLTSNSSFNMFRRKNKPPKGSGLDDDEEKDIFMDASTATMSFDDLTMMPDRGRFAMGGFHSDTAPIIPTLQSTIAKPNPDMVNNTTYRKQMTAQKKQALNRMRVQQDPRAQSLTGPPPMLYGSPGSRANSLQGQPLNPRAYSLINQSPSIQSHRDPRNNSLSNQRFPPGPPPPGFVPPEGRAYSLTTNPYQQQRRQHGGPHPQRMMPPPPSQQKMFPQQYPPPRQNGPTGQPLPQHYHNLPPNGHNTPQGTSNGYNKQQQQYSGPPKGQMRLPGRQRNSLPGVSSPLSRSTLNVSNHGATTHRQEQNEYGQQGSYAKFTQKQEERTENGFLQETQFEQRQTQQKTVMQTKQGPQDEHYEKGDFHRHVKVQSQKPEPTQQPVITEEAATDSQSHERSLTQETTSSSVDHHYLAENTIVSDGLPNEESTTSPFLDTSCSVPIGGNESPSRLPRSKALPHLSLLSLRGDDDSDEEIVKDFEDTSRVLDTLNESEEPHHFEQEIQSQRHAQTQTQSTETHELRSQNNTSCAQKTHKQSMSGYSMLSADTVTEAEQRGVYGQTSKSDMFVTASQFSLLADSAIGNSDHHTTLSPERIEIARRLDFPHRRVSNASRAERTDDSVAQSTAKSRGTAVMTPMNLVRGTQSTHPSVDLKRESVRSLHGSIPGQEGFIETQSINSQQRKSMNANYLDSLETPVVEQQAFPPSVHTTPLNIKRSSSESLSSSKSKGFKSPGFLKKWAKPFSKDKKKYGIFEPVVAPLNETTLSSTGTFESRNVSNIHERRGTGSGEVDDDVTNDDMDTVIHKSLDPIMVESDKLMDYDGASLPTAALKPLEKILGESFVPLPTIKVLEPAPSVSQGARLNFTVDQLGIMEDKAILIQELDLVSRELASSIKREINLEERLLQGKDNVPISPESNEKTMGEQLREQGTKIAELTRKLTGERRVRYIAEEYVLLHESKQAPSALKLNYELDQLKVELASREESINKLESEIESFKNEMDEARLLIQQLRMVNEENESVVIPNLKNEIQLLSKDAKRYSLLVERYKSLRSEKDDLEERLSLESRSPFHSPERSVAQRQFLSGNVSSSDKSVSPIRNSERLTSFSLLNVTGASK